VFFYFIAARAAPFLFFLSTTIRKIFPHHRSSWPSGLFFVEQLPVLLASTSLIVERNRSDTTTW